MPRIRYTMNDDVRAVGIFGSSENGSEKKEKGQKSIGIRKDLETEFILHRIGSTPCNSRLFAKILK